MSGIWACHSFSPKRLQISTLPLRSATRTSAPGRKRTEQGCSQISGAKLQVQQGTLYPALGRLEHDGLIASEWGTSENNRRAKYYRLTRAGRARLEAETASWKRMVSAIGAALSATARESE